MSYLIILEKLMLASLLGFFIGRERKKQDKHGGSRTFALVCLGSCLIALISLELLKMPRPEGVVINFTRMVSYAIASIGFIGSAVVIHHKGEVDGLTTASAIFGIVPVGIAIGFGYYFLGTVASVLIYILLEYKYWFDKGDV